MSKLKAISLLLVTFGLGIVPSLTYLVVPENTFYWLSVLLDFIVVLISVTLAAYNGLFQDWRKTFQIKNLMILFLIIIIAFLVVGLVNYISQLILGPIPSGKIVWLKYTNFPIWYMLLTPVFAAFMEELIYRAYFYKLFKNPVLAYF
ncbi:MAG: hypothetical protein LBI13_06790 [Streptococcaceae bacterium]|jgi:membrane protease YdiL (CAAX protease family)|nr:hypothetical protein [Streptococcaceae bacterium]